MNRSANNSTQRRSSFTILIPSRSDTIPQKGQAARATSSSAKPSVPTASPTPSFWPMRSVITNEMELLRKTRKLIENSATPHRYVTTWRRLAVKGDDRAMALVELSLLDVVEASRQGSRSREVCSRFTVADGCRDKAQAQTAYRMLYGTKRARLVTNGVVQGKQRRDDVCCRPKKVPHPLQQQHLATSASRETIAQLGTDIQYNCDSTPLYSPSPKASVLIVAQGWPGGSQRLYIARLVCRQSAADVTAGAWKRPASHRKYCQYETQAPATVLRPIWTALGLASQWF